MERLGYLIYSSNRKKSCTDDEVQDILDSCQRNNRQKEITGVLLHSNYYFLQYLEGEPTAIKGLYNSIKSDARHERALLLSEGDLDKRNFPSWQMGYKDLDNQDLMLETTSSTIELQAFRNLLEGKQNTGSKPIETLVRFYKLI